MVLRVPPPFRTNQTSLPAAFRGGRRSPSGIPSGIPGVQPAVRNEEAMSILKSTKPTLDEYLNEMMGGVQTALPSTLKTMVVNGQQMTPAQVVAEIKGYLPTFAAVAT